MSQDLVINGVTYNGVESLSMVNTAGAIVKYTEALVIPSHWQTYLEEKIETIQALQAGGPDRFSFLVIADPHYTQNLGKCSGSLAREIMERCGIKWAILLGDFQNRGSWGTKDQALAEWDGIREMFLPITDRSLWQRGNHDGSWGNALNSVTYPYNFTPEELYDLVYTSTYAEQNVVTDDSGTGYYVDDTARKVRYILLNTQCNPYVENADGAAKYNNMQYFRFTQSQYDLVVEALSSVPGDTWAVVVAAHAPINNSYNEAFGGDNSTGDHVNMRQLLTAYKNKTAVSIVWDGTGETGGDDSGGGGTTGSYTNLFDVNGSGFEKQGDAKYLTNWIPYNPADNDGTGTIYHIKGFLSNSGYQNPYKMHFAEDENGKYGSNPTGGTALIYCANASPKPTQKSDYDQSVVIVQHNQKNDSGYNFKYVQFEFREKMPGNLIITANEPIVDVAASAASAEGDSVAYDAVYVDTDFTNAKGELVGYFAGHIHNDYHYAAGGGWGIDIITTRCDGASENDSALLAQRVAGTTTEQSFDVFTVDRAARKIYRTKIGAGEDQVINL